MQVSGAITAEQLLDYAEKEFGLRPRAGQRQMLNGVAEVLNGEEKFGIIEAGTGTGKTYAYLIPVGLYCLAAGQRAVVSTGTKTLQQQLLDKDLPCVSRLLAAATGHQLKFTLLYGRANYVCPKLLREKTEAAGDFVTSKNDQETRFYLYLEEWLDEGGSGIWEDLPAISEEKWDYWSKISADSDDAICAGCKETDCPWMKARRKAATSQIVVVNHWLLAADFELFDKIDLRLFGETEPAILVVDEAHEFRDVVKTVGRRVFSRNRLRALLVSLEEIEKRIPVPEVRLGNDPRRAWELVAPAVYELEDWAQAFLGPNSLKSLEPGAIPPEIVAELDQRLDSFLQLLAECVKRLNDSIDDEEDGWEKAPEPGDETYESRLRLLKRIERLSERINAIRLAFDGGVKTVSHYLKSGTSGDVCCVERSQGVRFVSWPFDPVPKLTSLYELYQKIIFTSATLFPATRSGTEWFLKRNGIPGSTARILTVPSPFDYQKQMRAFVLTDNLLLPQDTNPYRLEALGRAVFQAVQSTEGGCLVLCTSYTELRAVAAYLRHRLSEDRPLFVQGEAGKSELLQQFRDNGRAVLVGVASFWQGVDVPGDALKTLVIARIPFPVPDDPDIQAECYFARSRWWQEVFVPQASLAMKQGIGRLIRTETDTGVVIIADPRAARRHRHLVEACLPVKPSVIACLENEAIDRH